MIINDYLYINNLYIQKKTIKIREIKKKNETS